MSLANELARMDVEFGFRDYAPIQGGAIKENLHIRIGNPVGDLVFKQIQKHPDPGFVVIELEEIPVPATGQYPPIIIDPTRQLDQTNGSRLFIVIILHKLTGSPEIRGPRNTTVKVTSGGGGGIE